MGETGRIAPMTEQAKSMVMSTAPWRRGIPWPIVMIEGVALAGIGIYMLASDSASDVVRQLIAAFLLVNGLLEVVGGFKAEDSLGARYRVMRGTIGATIGAIITLEPFWDFLTNAAARWILGLGFLTFAILGFAVLVITREQGGLRWGAAVMNLAFLVLAILFFTGDESNDTRITLLGTVAIILGVLLVLYAVYLRRSTETAAVGAPDSKASTGTVA
jgi:uncharacterized membrane protein HdeD (DUF308 family)